MGNSISRQLRSAWENSLAWWTRDRGVTRNVNGSRLRVDTRTRALFTSSYDEPVAEYLRARVTPGAEIWNVGANVGVYVLQLGMWLGGTGRVVAFEPNPRAIALLERNIRLNDLDALVTVVPEAVGERSGTTEFFAAAADGMSRAGLPNPLLTDAEAMRVPVTTLDDFAARAGTKPSIVVMDVEGWEISALRGGRGVLRDAAVVVELHPNAWEWSGHSRRDLEEILEEGGLECVPLTGQADPLSEYGIVALERRA